MKTRNWPVAALTLLGWTYTAMAQTPAALPTPVRQQAQAATAANAPNPNQVLADTVAARVRAIGTLSGADIAIMAHDHTVTLTGTVRDPQQKQQVIETVRRIPGVHVVRAGLQVHSVVVAAQNAQPAQPGAAQPVKDGVIVEPAPLGIPGPMAPEWVAPPLPPYAWPTYAPYPNFSRVAYPTAYPYNAFPFIGPFYPFPKVPLGWRKVVLEWEDGYWFYGRASTPHDYWRVRFW